MPSEHPSIRTAFYWIATAVVGLNLPVSALDVAAHPGAYVPGFAQAVLAVLAVLTLTAAWRAVLGYGAGHALRAVVGLCFLALAAHPWVLTGPVAYPPLLHVLGAGMSVSAIWSIRGSLVLIPAFAWGVAALRAPTIGAWQAGTEAALLAMGGLVGTACVDVFTRAARSVNDAVGRSWEVAEERARIAERATARERWDGLIHDKVLGALSLAVRSADGVSPAAQQLAGDALAALRGTVAAAAPALLAQWSAHAQMLGLDVLFRVRGTATDPGVSEALLGAVNEALSNVARHSGQRTATVAGSVSDSHVLLSVADPGVGFDPGRVGRRLGIATSVIARMRSVGGTADVRTAPGSGTTVVLTWQRTQSVTSRSADAWELRSVLPMTAVAAGVLAATLVASYPQWSAARLPGLSVALIAAVVVLSVSCVIVDTSRRNGLTLAAIAVGVAIAGSWNTPVDAGVDWRYWYLSALVPAVSILAFRFGAATGGGVVLVVSLLGVGSDVAAGRPALDLLTQAVPVLVATALAARLIRAALADAWELVEETTRHTAELRRALVEEAERESEGEARAAALIDEVEPALTAIAAGRPLAPHEVAGLDALGSAVRDQLAAASLLDAHAARELRVARARGVVVDIVTADDDRVAAVQPAQSQACRAVLTAVVRRAAAGTWVRVTWSPGEQVLGTLVVVGSDVLDLAEAARGAADGGARVRITVDEDAALVELHASA